MSNGRARAVAPSPVTIRNVTLALPERDRLLKWYASNGRAFPWRTDRTRYGVVLAEVLLQKTRAEAVESVWRAVVDVFPTPRSILEASDDEIYQLVSSLGLGTQRVRRIRAAVSSIVGGDGAPGGLSTYGSAMVALSMGRRPSSTPVDGNIARVVMRITGLAFVRGEPRKKREILSYVRALLEDVAPNEALSAVLGLVDLGALICKPRKPLCDECPLVAVCAFASARPEI
jgi:A/G-specific adenine glycosylase